MKPQRRGQGQCGSKARYATRRIAEQVRRETEAKTGDRLRVYGCPDCGGFHLTGKLRRFQEEGE